MQSRWRYYVMWEQSLHDASVFERMRISPPKHMHSQEWERESFRKWLEVCVLRSGALFLIVVVLTNMSLLNEKQNKRLPICIEWTDFIQIDISNNRVKTIWNITVLYSIASPVEEHMCCNVHKHTSAQICLYSNHQYMIKYRSIPRFIWKTIEFFLIYLGLANNHNRAVNTEYHFWNCELCSWFFVHAV